MPEVSSLQDSNKALVRASFDRWSKGTGTPFELISPDAEWTHRADLLAFIDRLADQSLGGSQGGGVAS
jgi:ketosteroid isomerase-like protein